MGSRPVPVQTCTKYLKVAQRLPADQTKDTILTFSSLSEGLFEDMWDACWKTWGLVCHLAWLCLYNVVQDEIPTELDKANVRKAQCFVLLKAGSKQISDTLKIVTEEI
ncbi:hypothetical protein EK904_007057 [Melospiza melodia maxima]|nr:hypothetical protein EK904_007057 [Melospiza melodia maxima]